MAWNVLQVLALSFGVIYHVYAHRDRDSSDSDEDGNGDGNGRKIIVMSVFGVILVAIITVIVVACICKKKNANRKRTTPSEAVVAVVGADPLPVKMDISSSNTLNPDSVYNITPNYDEVNKTQEQPNLDRPFVSPPPAYSYDQ